MVWVLEGTSVSVATNMGQLIQQRLELPDTAMSYLYSHGSLDQEHIRLLAGLMDRVEDPIDQQAIIDAANRIFFLYGEMLRQIAIPAHCGQKGVHDAVSA